MWLNMFILICFVLLQVLRIKPPMCINKEDVDFTISVLDETLKNFLNNNQIKA